MFNLCQYANRAKNIKVKSGTAHLLTQDVPWHIVRRPAFPSPFIALPTFSITQIPSPPDSLIHCDHPEPQREARLRADNDKLREELDYLRQCVGHDKVAPPSSLPTPMPTHHHGGTSTSTPHLLRTLQRPTLATAL